MTRKDLFKRTEVVVIIMYMATIFATTAIFNDGKMAWYTKCSLIYWTLYL